MATGFPRWKTQDWVFTALFSTLMIGLHPPAHAALSLHECFQSALRQSESLAIQDELIQQAEEHFRQARGGLLPTVTGSASYQLQPTPGSATGQNFSPPSQTTVRLNLTQPLFQGLREFAALRQNQNLMDASQLSREHAALQLFQDVTQSFYQVLSLESDLQNRKNEIQLNQKRLQELTSFKRLGRARSTDVLTLESNLAALEAQIASLQGQRDAARSTLLFLSGVAMETPLQDTESLPNGMGSLSDYLKDLESRPDIQSLLKTVRASEEGVAFAKGGHFPTLSFSGNYFFQRPGLLSDVHWDAQLLLSVPLFQGGVIQSQVRLTTSLLKQNELTLAQTRRRAQNEVETLFRLYQSDYAQFEKQKRAVELSEKTYRAELQDYRLGLVTNLDVLQSLTTYQENQRVLNRTEFQLKSDYLRLKTAAGIKIQRSQG